MIMMYLHKWYTYMIDVNKFRSNNDDRINQLIIYNKTCVVSCAVETSLVHNTTLLWFNLSLIDTTYIHCCFSLANKPASRDSQRLVHHQCQLSRVSQPNSKLIALMQCYRYKCSLIFSRVTITLWVICDSAYFALWLQSFSRLNKTP